jgi:carotenoid cleavage dioxygenase-like enzyme
MGVGKQAATTNQTIAEHTGCQHTSKQISQGSKIDKLNEDDTLNNVLAVLMIAGEPVFVARPGAKDEDDGVVIAPGVTVDGRGLMLVLDAHSWSELAQVELPFSVPNRFHGLWMKDTNFT